jgi:hypothetical protein
MKQRSKNFIVHIYHGSEALDTLLALRTAFAKHGATIKWYKTNTGYSVYFRGSYVRRKAKPVVQPAVVEHIIDPFDSGLAFQPERAVA